MSSPSRKKTGQLYVRLEHELAEEYKELLKREGKTVTEDIEHYLHTRLSKTEKTRTVNIEEFNNLAQKVIDIEKKLGKLQAS